MKKVLLVSGSLPPIRCGVGDYSARLSQEMARQKVDFELLSTKGVNADVPAPMQTIRNWRIVSIPKMLSAIKRSQAGIIHIQYPAVGYRRQLGINLLPHALRIFRPRLKIIITLHEYHASRWVGRWRNLITVWPVHKIIVSNQTDKAALPARLRSKVQVIPIGATFEAAKPDPDFYQKIMKANKLDLARPTLMFFGHAFPTKKLELLLDAMAEPALQNYQLLLIGSLDNKTAYQRMLRNKITELNQTNSRVASTGFLAGDKASAIMQAGKYFILPNDGPLSAKSSSAIAAVENELIVISHGSSQPGDTTPFVHLKNCYLVKQPTPQTIAAAVDHLESSPKEVEAIRQGATELKKYFSWNNIVKQHLKLYEEL